MIFSVFGVYWLPKLKQLLQFTVVDWLVLDLMFVSLLFLDLWILLGLWFSCKFSSYLMNFFLVKEKSEAPPTFKIL